MGQVPPIASQLMFEVYASIIIIKNSIHFEFPQKFVAAEKLGKIAKHQGTIPLKVYLWKFCLHGAS